MTITLAGLQNSQKSWSILQKILKNYGHDVVIKICDNYTDEEMELDEVWQDPIESVLYFGCVKK